MESVQERVAKRAYELFEARGGQHGYHIEDWLQAEKEVSNSIAAAAKPKTVKKAAVKKPEPKAEKKAAAPKKKMALKK
jgi:hypothetical protein